MYHHVNQGWARSELLRLIKGAPQGSIIGPFSYTVHSKDFNMFLARLCEIFNYADDNTVNWYGQNVTDVKQK